jgi:hypothetical protein
MPPIVSPALRVLLRQVRPEAGGNCLVCGRGIASREEEIGLRGGVHVHRACATYRMRRRCEGEERLGYPRRVGG